MLTELPRSAGHTHKSQRCSAFLLRYCLEYATAALLPSRLYCLLHAAPLNSTPPCSLRFPLKKYIRAPQGWVRSRGGLRAPAPLRTGGRGRGEGPRQAGPAAPAPGTVPHALICAARPPLPCVVAPWHRRAPLRLALSCVFTFFKRVGRSWESSRRPAIPPCPNQFPPFPPPVRGCPLTQSAELPLDASFFKLVSAADALSRAARRLGAPGLDAGDHLVRFVVLCFGCVCLCNAFI